MQIEISGHHVEITPALSDIIHKKIAQLAHKWPEDLHIRVVLSVDKHSRHTAEARVHVPHTELHASAETHDMYESINNLMKKLDTQILKWKES
jgi:putative sigma-54 modulation protein